MRALEWKQYLETEQRSNSKTVFTCAELANVAGTSLRCMRVSLDRLQKQGVLVRYAHGRYGVPGAVSADTLLPTLDSGGYITGAYALFRHNLITQIPREISCFTNRRHNRSRIRETPLGRFVFATLQPPIYNPPIDSVIAPAEQALCDYVYLAAQRGLTTNSQVTFLNLETIMVAALADLLGRYPATVRRNLDLILSRRSQIPILPGLAEALSSS
jgi:hypothetical protein